MLDLLINLIFMLAYIFFLLALFASAVYEVILTTIKARKKLLQEALENFMPDDYWKNELWPRIVQSPFLQVLMRNARDDKSAFPSYVPSRSFALAFMDALRQIDLRFEISDNPAENSAQSFIETISKNIPEEHKEMIANIEEQFEERMQRLSGWFKRKYQPILFVIGFIISVALNVDTIHITKHFWSNPEDLAMAVDSIEADIEKANSTYQNYRLEDTTVVDTVAQDTTIAVVEQQIATLEKQLEAIKAVSAPMGWENISVEQARFDDGIFLFWFFKILGWLLTCIAISLGAPFWFDVFNKVTNLRGTGKKPLDILKKLNQ